MSELAENNVSIQTGEDTSSARANRLATRIGILTAALLSISTVIFICTSLNYYYWQLYLLAGTFAIGFLFAVVAIFVRFTKFQPFRALWLGPAVAIPLIVIAATVQNLALEVALICFLFGTILSTGSLQGRAREFGISAAFFTAVVISLAGTFSPIQQVRIPLLDVYVPSLLGVLLMTYVVLLVMDYVTADLRIKLMTVSLAVAIFPLILLSVIDSRFIQSSLQKENNQALKMAAEQTGSAIDSFLLSNKELVLSQSRLDVFVDYLSMDPEKRNNSPEEQAVKLTLGSIAVQEQPYLRSFGVLNMRGTVIYDINPLQISKDEISLFYFKDTVSTGQPRISSVQFFKNSSDGFLYFSSPVHNARQQLIGILRLQYDGRVLQHLLEENINLIGARSYPILLDENFLRLADTLSPNSIYKLLAPLPSTQLTLLMMDQRLPDVPIYMMDTGDESLVPILSNYLTNPFFTTELHTGGSHSESGVVTVLNNQPWYLVFVKEQTSLTALVQSQGKTSSLISTLIAAVVGFFSTMIAGAFSRPITRLHSTAEKIIAGDLDAQAQVETSDEIGSLARAFNNMTFRLKTFINELEDRVRERTQELARQNEALIVRSRQLQTVSDVARGIISTQEFEGLLTQVTSLVSDRFNFYHVGIFLLDTKGEYAVLRAANSEGGRRMLARRHRLKIGEVGIVGHVCAAGEPRIATDVGQDAVFFNNPDLPITQSEMALPLKSNKRIIGALDVQSTESNAFTQEDIELFSTLADQISIAIVNNQLFNETVKALEESQRIHRQYLQREWTSEIEDRQTRAFHYSVQGTETQPEISSPEIERALKIGKPVAMPAEGPDKPAVLAVPIKLRGEMIGVIHLKDAGLPNRVWNEDEITSISSVADQVGLALENARLLEKTIRRSERDRRALEITGKIRSTSDPQSMVEIALAELQQALKASRAHIILKNPASTAEQKLTAEEPEKSRSV